MTQRAFVRRFGAVLVVVLLVVLPPVALMALAGWPLPRSMPSWGAVEETLNGPNIPSVFLIKVLGTAGWFFYGAAALCVVAEVAAAAKGRLPADLGLMDWVQRKVRRLVQAAVDPDCETEEVPSDGALLRARVAALWLGNGNEREWTSFDGEPVHDWRARPEFIGTHTRYIVPGGRGRERVTLWRLAEEGLGDGRRWREIFDLNAHRLQPDGLTLAHIEEPMPGWELLMPSPRPGPRGS